MQSNKVSVLLVLGVALLINKIEGLKQRKECGLLNNNREERSLPWVVNIYRTTYSGDKEFLCLGTIIARKIILTAAHCFYDDLTRQLKDGPYTITTGQTSKGWHSDDNVQLREITEENIIIPEKYTGLDKMYSDNIAIIKLNPENKLNVDDNVVKRACVHWDNDFIEPDYRQSPLDLKLVVWGESQNASFKVLNPTFVQFSACMDIVPQNFRQFLTFDKMCTQLKGSHNVPCTGSGLYALNKDNNRWYLIGIASGIESDGDKTIVTFTKVQLHLNWISNTAFLHLR